MAAYILVASSLAALRLGGVPRAPLAMRAKVLAQMPVESVEECIETIDSLIQHHEFEHLLLRMGKGSPSHRNRLANAMLARGYAVELVNEQKTSRGVKRNQHGVSAIRIATLSGERVWEPFELQTTQGEIREIQRRSRIKSQGRITISSELARQVALGELTLLEAINLI